MKRKANSILVFHPFLIAISPALSLYIINQYKMNLSSFLWVVGILLTSTGLIWLLINRLVRNIRKSAFLVSIFLIMMFTFQSLIYGVNVLYVLTGASEEVLHLITQESFLVYCFLLELFLFILVCIKLVRIKSDFFTLTKVINFFSAIMVVIIMTSWLQSEIGRTINRGSFSDPFTKNWKSYVESEPCQLKRTADYLPDIYIIVLDGYGRDDVLNQLYGMDNTYFISELEQRGFYVARNARSNYRHTELTISSLLNYDYLENLADTTGLDVLNSLYFGPVIQNNRTFHQLKCLGYTIQTIDTGYYYTEFRSGVEPISVGFYPDRFFYELTDSTPLKLLTLQNQYNLERARMLSTIKKLDDLPPVSSPRLIFAHVMTGHTPFIFDEKGQPVNPPREMRFDSDHEFVSLMNRDAFTKGYRDQVGFVSKEMLMTIDSILAKSENPPIILMFGDHGPSMRLENIWERMSIFSSYYFPGQMTSNLFEDISPVNSMRVVLNTYFGEKLPILPYIGNFAADVNLYDFQDVTNDIPDNKYQ